MAPDAAPSCRNGDVLHELQAAGAFLPDYSVEAMQAKKFHQVQLTTTQFGDAAGNAAFDAQSRCVCALFARFAKARGAELPDAWGIVGEFRDPPAPAGVAAGDGAVAIVTQLDDVRGVMSLPDTERKRAFLHLILRTLDLFFGGATPRPYLDAATDVRGADFVNAWPWKAGAKRSPDHTRRAVVTVAHELREFEIRLAVDDARGNPGFETVLVRGDKPDEIIIHGWLGELRWDGPDRVVLHPKLASRAPLVVDLPSF
jgi:hypothetical protein